MAQIHKLNGVSYVVEFHQDKYLQGWALDEVLFSGESSFQKVDVVKTKYMGNMLLNDELVMTSDRDEFSYHEMMAHVPLFTHPKPERILIIGGGDGGTAREVLKHPSVKECVMVEIDDMVVKASRDFIPSTSCELDNPRLKLIIDDGVKYVKETEKHFDVILIDSTDPIGPGAPLFGDEFYQNVKKLLNPKGVVVAQGECAWIAPKAQEGLLNIIRKNFSVVGLYNYTNITYPGGTWSFTWASEDLNPRSDFKAERVDELNLELRYYNKNLHTACFSLPQFYYDMYGDFLTI